MGDEQRVPTDQLLREARERFDEGAALDAEGPVDAVGISDQRGSTVVTSPTIASSARAPRLRSRDQWII